MLMRRGGRRNRNFRRSELFICLIIFIYCHLRATNRIDICWAVAKERKNVNFGKSVGDNLDDCRYLFIVIRDSEQQIEQFF